MPQTLRQTWRAPFTGATLTTPGEVSERVTLTVRTDAREFREALSRAIVAHGLRAEVDDAGILRRCDERGDARPCDKKTGQPLSNREMKRRAKSIRGTGQAVDGAARLGASDRAYPFSASFTVWGLRAELDAAIRELAGAGALIATEFGGDRRHGIGVWEFDPDERGGAFRGGKRVPPAPYEIMAKRKAAQRARVAAEVTQRYGEAGPPDATLAPEPLDSAGR